MRLKDIFKNTQSINNVYVIAEAGVNHNGNMDLAIKLIHSAKECGADAVKFQTFKADEISKKDTPKANYQIANTGGDESQFEMLKKLELNKQDFKRLKTECESVGIEFLSTPYNISDIELLCDLDISAIKIASAISVETEFLKSAGSKKLPVILSTGMCTLAEVSQSVDTLRQNGCDQIILLQCTTNYPSDLKDSNIIAMKNMGQMFGLPYGYSDHTDTNVSVIAAVAHGACVVEKHFTLDKKLPGPDHSSSCDVEELKSYIYDIRATLECLGNGRKIPVEAELLNKEMMRRGVVAKSDLTKGTLISYEHIAYKRPETELKTYEIDKIIGKVLNQDLSKDQEIKTEFFHEA